MVDTIQNKVGVAIIMSEKSFQSKEIKPGL